MLQSDELHNLFGGMMKKSQEVMSVEINSSLILSHAGL